MNIEGQLLGLGGLIQAVHAVLELAHTGRCQERALEVAIDSILRIDAESPAAIFGGVANLVPGLALLADQLDGRKRDHGLSRVAATILHLERQLERRPKLRADLLEGISGAARSAASLGSANDSVIARLDDLYVSTVSTLRPRVLVQGNVLYLSQPRVVARIRTLLLAALRAAVLWRQMGGSRLRLLLRRHSYAAQARQLIGTT
jgi:high frequency lysogenization protein